MWPNRRERLDELILSLEYFAAQKRALPGVAGLSERRTLATQMVASLRRIDYTNILKTRDIHPDRANPHSSMFDPERAAIFHHRAGDLDEAIWLIFLATHFGKHSSFGWRRVQDVYSRLGEGCWTWDTVSENPEHLSDWLAHNHEQIGGAFGNHRKYESLAPDARSATGKVLESYVGWVTSAGSHEELFSRIIHEGGNDPHSIFRAFYENMKVFRFGRLGKFDFLALLGRLDLAPIAPGVAYLSGATGPLAGARLLFGGSTQSNLIVQTLERWLQELDVDLDVGMQVMEDALCNWQKSPDHFIHFVG